MPIVPIPPRLQNPGVTGIDPLIQHIAITDPKLWEALRRLMKYSQNALNSLSEGQLIEIPDFRDFSYVTALKELGLPKARLLTAGTNITLTDEGAGKRLIISASGGSSGCPSNTSTACITEDFLGGDDTSGSIGQLGWSIYKGSTADGAVYYTTSAGQAFDGSPSGQTDPGVLGVNGPSVGGDKEGTIIYSNGYGGTNVGLEIGIQPGLNLFSSRWRVVVQNNDLHATIILGHATNLGSFPLANVPDGLFFEKKDGDTNWFINAFGARTDTGIANSEINGNWGWFKIRIIDATHVGFTMLTQSHPAGAEVSIVVASASKQYARFLQFNPNGSTTHELDWDFFDCSYTGLDRDTI